MGLRLLNQPPDATTLEECIDAWADGEVPHVLGEPVQVAAVRLAAELARLRRRSEALDLMLDHDAADLARDRLGGWIPDDVYGEVMRLLEPAYRFPHQRRGPIAPAGGPLVDLAIAGE